MPEVPGASFLSEIRGQPQALGGLLEHEADYARVAAVAREPGRDDRAHGRARLLGQRCLVRRLRIRPAAGLDRPPRLDLALRLLRHTPRHSRRNRDRSLAVGADSGRHRVRLPRPEGGCLHGRAHERSRVRPGGGGRGSAAAGRGPGAVGRGDEDVSEPDRRAGAPRRPLRRRRPTLRRGPPRDGPAPGGDDPSLGGADPHCRAPLRLGRPDVRDRPRHRVRNGPRDRAEAARNVPSRGRASDRDCARARPRRGARPALPRLDDRLGRRDAARRGGSGSTRAGCRCHARREWQRGGSACRMPPTCYRCRSRRFRCSRRCSRSCRDSCLPGRSPRRGASTRTTRRASAR